ncbi:hypothetical protein BH24ACI3_BH24ACI3_13840 [soil metagenome]
MFEVFKLIRIPEMPYCRNPVMPGTQASRLQGRDEVPMPSQITFLAMYGN